ncbi:glutamine-hydrolyzing carbamoyl-phosphate synthase small subunit [Candidatus Peregrinibacteria bacterium]|nr:glutamine-hydrolyzing carbamoyl-phosphate synthase small subunit [Candidatus Peregrinibacteria bacterium]
MASLVLADGTVFTGTSFGADVSNDGEVVFNTGMAGYPESLTDPSYRGQILVFTYPLIGNYGVPSEELNAWGFSKNFESEGIHARGVIVAEVSEDYSHHTAVKPLGDWLKDHGIPAITGIDTRALTKKLREHGVMLGKIASEELRVASGELRIEDPNVLNLVAEVSCNEVITYEPELATRNSQLATVIAYDCGMKRNILRSFLKRGVRVIRVPWDFDLSRFDGEYDGVFFSNGPGDPKTCVPTIKSMAWAIERGIPTFGICLGNQLMALAIGGDTFKLKYGHRGVNQPCVEIENGKLKIDNANNAEIRRLQRCIITSQNHGFAVSEKLPKDWSVWFRNANDGTVEGIRHASGRFFSVQFHPEATPGPEDANDLFDDFVKLMSTRTDR